MSRYLSIFLFATLFSSYIYGNTRKVEAVKQIEEDSTISVLKLTKKTTNREKVKYIGTGERVKCLTVQKMSNAKTSISGIITGFEKNALVLDNTYSIPLNTIYKIKKKTGNSNVAIGVAALITSLLIFGIAYVQFLGEAFILSLFAATGSNKGSFSDGPLQLLILSILTFIGSIIAFSKGSIKLSNHLSDESVSNKYRAEIVEASSSDLNQ